MRTKNANAITHLEFAQGVRLYEDQHLWKKAITVIDGQPQFGYTFEYPDENTVTLMMKGKPIGRASWADGLVFFDPDFRPSGLTLDSMIDDWIASAQYHDTTGLPHTSGKAR